MVFDSALRITDLVCKWPGSAHDSFIWNNSHLKYMFETGKISSKCWLLGDSDYPLQPWLLTPILVPRGPAQIRYNSCHRSTRCLAERGIGRLKQRFRCLDSSGGKLLFSPKKTCQIITACAILHNLSINRQIPLPDEQGKTLDIINHSDCDNASRYKGAINIDGMNVRDTLINSRFV